LSPDGSQIAFASNRDGPTHIFRMGIDGSQLTRLTESAAGDTLPSWSPDGTSILYMSLLPNHNWEVFVMAPDGAQKTNLTENPAIDTSASWSPDGTHIVFETDRDGDFEIYVMGADGLGPTNLTQNPAAYDISPVWTEDGSQIVFRSDRDGQRFEYRSYVMNADGSDVTPLD
jgi:Tol biopolymer transport system component